MSPPVPSGKLTLSYPLYCADFDPRNNDFLLVAGGGGEGRSGVGNKITLLDASKRTEIAEVVDVELSRDEDSVTSLAVVKSADSSVTSLAGINSSEKEQAKGKNEHLRSFRLEYPPRRSTTTTTSMSKEGEAEKIKNEKEAKNVQGGSGGTTPLGQVALFTPSTAVKKETYQRTIRVSPFKGEDKPRVAVIATGLAPEGEIVVFKAHETPQKTDELGRVRLDERQEAADVDILQLEGDGEDGQFLLAYCTDYEVFVCKVPLSSKGKTALQPSLVYGTPFPDTPAKKGRPKFRALRFLSPTRLLLLQNMADRRGATLQVLNLMSHESIGLITRERRLHKSLKIALGMDVCALSASPAGNRQIAIAVAGSDHSIEVVTVEQAPSNALSAFRLYSILRDVHPLSMTKIAFSTFIPPTLPVSPDTKPQYIKLASVSMGNTVVVHTFPLSPTPSSQSRTPRYILQGSAGGETLQTALGVTMALLVIGVAAFLLQAFTEIRGGVPPTLGAADWLSPYWKDKIAIPYMFSEEAASSISSALPSVIPTEIPVVVQDASQSLRDLLQSAQQYITISTTTDTENNENPDSQGTANQQQQQQQQTKALLIRDEGTDVSAELRQDIDVVAGEARRWEELHEHEREGWRRKLSEAGHWAVEEGETVLKGVFFGELGAFVGDVVRGAA